MTTQHRLIPAAAVALALAAGAAPAAARYDYRGAVQSPNVRADTQSLGAAPAAGRYDYRGAAESLNVRAGIAPLRPRSAPPATVVQVSPANGGFDWGDAGIGAAGGIALSMLGLGSALTLTHRRTRHDESATALTS